MTTVVYDGKLLAADTQTTAVGQRDSEYKCGHCDEPKLMVRTEATTKLYLVADRHKNPLYKGAPIIALAQLGCSESSRKVINAILGGNDPETLLAHARILGAVFTESNSWTVIVVTQVAVWELFFNTKSLSVTEHAKGEFQAWGSGKTAANIGKAIGWDACRSIALAIIGDTYTGGDVIWMNTEAPVGSAGYTLTKTTEMANTCVKISELIKAACDSTQVKPKAARKPRAAK